MQRFDVNKDGVVDYADFLRYVTGVCDAAARASKRIADAAEEIRSWAVEKQNKKLARDGNIDSSTAWKLLKPKRGIIESAALDHVRIYVLIYFSTSSFLSVYRFYDSVTSG
jgi:hypothetical protein